MMLPDMILPIPNSQFPIPNSQFPKSAAFLFYTRLHAPERRINSVLFDKLFVLPRFYHYPLMHHKNAVSIADSRKTVGDRNCSAILGNSFERSLNCRLQIGRAV